MIPATCTARRLGGTPALPLLVEPKGFTKENRMKKHFVAILLAAGAAALLAQGPRGPQGSGRTEQQAALDMNKQFVVEGAVTAVHIAYGAQYPSIEVNKTQVKIAPVWFLLENDFEIKTGDKLRIVAAPSTLPSDPYPHAIEILNTVSNKKITLRDADGTPEWARARARGSNGSGNQSQGGCIDPASVQVITGNVDKVTMGAGIEMPTLVLKTQDGKLASIKIGPERTLLENDFEIHAGETVTAKVALATCSEELVALELTNAAGRTVVLRDSTGAPNWR